MVGFGVVCSIRETPNGTVCNTSWPSQTFGRYGGLEAMAGELDGIAAGIAASLAN